MRPRLIETVRTVSADRHKLVILLGDFDAGKTALLKDVAAEIKGQYVNLNLELTERLLTLPRRQYADGVTAHRLIDELCDELSPKRETLLVDNIELLFSPELGKLNPLDTFKRMSRQRPVILALPARRVGNQAEYSSLGQADYLKALQTSTDLIPDLRDLLAENFGQADRQGCYHWPNPQLQVELDEARHKRLLRLYDDYLKQVQAGQRLKEVRKEALVTGFTESYRAGRFQDILAVGKKLPKRLLENNPDLFDFVDIAEAKVEG